jgi:putative transcriptional regulator
MEMKTMKPYHYTESGLDNVWLDNGVIVENDPDYGEVYAIQDLDGLHRIIGNDLIHLPRSLKGAEFRFLRRELDLSQKALAGLIGSNEQSVAKWEKARDKSIGNRVADRLLRLLYAESIDKPIVKDLLEGLSELDEIICESEFHLQHAGDEWQHAA